ncbi:carbon storage regulator [Virgibacillus salexigens]|uniref:Carbon storage regulator n=1 Tax=Virgibacillus massiliensis TaxID=1462526 RepID=A0A024QHQ5_9BACI|nr:carbon storage regulator [Virgibacillus massiliensis]CDQ41745.1 carbon storage regulator [Virgibacillus massiliensis]
MALQIRRNEGEKFLIVNEKGEKIEIKILEEHGHKQIPLSIEAPPNYKIWREEIYKEE